jgi:hypothetical protein
VRRGDEGIMVGRYICMDLSAGWKSMRAQPGVCNLRDNDNMGKFGPARIALLNLRGYRKIYLVLTQIYLFVMSIANSRCKIEVANEICPFAGV